MATKKEIKATEIIEALVLCDCGFGKACDVVVLSNSIAQIGVENGVLDTHPAAIEHAKTKS